MTRGLRALALVVCVAGCRKATHRDSPEAKLGLDRIHKLAKVALAAEDQVPQGKAGPTPSRPCCETGGLCAQTREWDTDPVWSKLEFSLTEESHYRYTYESTGPRSFKATAIGDVDCDGKPGIWTMDVELGEPGRETLTIRSPVDGTY